MLSKTLGGWILMVMLEKPLDFVYIYIYSENDDRGLKDLDD